MGLQGYLMPWFTEEIVLQQNELTQQYNDLVLFTSTMLTLTIYPQSLR